MRYDEFRDRWQAALRTARVLAHHDRAEETIDLTTTGRRWRVHLLGRPAEPFHAGATISFRWDPFESARSYTCEEDLLTDLVGRRAARSTQPRLVRVDITFRATLPYGSTTPMPAPDVWAPWVASVEEKSTPRSRAGAAGRARRSPGAVIWRSTDAPRRAGRSQSRGCPCQPTRWSSCLGSGTTRGVERGRRPPTNRSMASRGASPGLWIPGRRASVNSRGGSGTRQPRRAPERAAAAANLSPTTETPGLKRCTDTRRRHGPEPPHGHRISDVTLLAREPRRGWRPRAATRPPKGALGRLRRRTVWPTSVGSVQGRRNPPHGAATVRSRRGDPRLDSMSREGTSRSDYDARCGRWG